MTFRNARAVYPVEQAKVAGEMRTARYQELLRNLSAAPQNTAHIVSGKRMFEVGGRRFQL